MITHIQNLDLEEMFADESVRDAAKKALASLPANSWLIGPIWHPEKGFIEEPQIVPDFELPIELKNELDRLNAWFQSTYAPDYPPDSEFRSQADKDEFELAAWRLSKLMQAHIGSNTTLEYDQ